MKFFLNLLQNHSQMVIILNKRKVRAILQICSKNILQPNQKVLQIQVCDLGTFIKKSRNLSHVSAYLQNLQQFLMRARVVKIVPRLQAEQNLAHLDLILVMAKIELVLMSRSMIQVTGLGTISQESRNLTPVSNYRTFSYEI